MKKDFVRGDAVYDIKRKQVFIYDPTIDYWLVSKDRDNFRIATEQEKVFIDEDADEDERIFECQ